MISCTKISSDSTVVCLKICIIQLYITYIFENLIFKTVILKKERNNNKITKSNSFLLIFEIDKIITIMVKIVDNYTLTEYLGKG